MQGSPLWSSTFWNGMPLLQITPQLRNHWWVYWPKHFNESHGHTEFYICQTNCLTMKVFYLLNLRIYVFWSIANLSYDSESVDTLSDRTHFILTCSSGRLRQEHRWQTGCISYKFLVADYETDPATLSYKSLWHFDAPFYFSYWLAAYPMCLWHFEDNHTSLEHWSTSTNHMNTVSYKSLCSVLCSQHFWWQRCFFISTNRHPSQALFGVLSFYTTS